MATTLRFRLKVSRSEALRYYKGEARFVNVRASNGQRLQFPAEHIRPFITESGVDGLFTISFDDNHKMIGVQQL
jgi:hypothetical protein